MPIQIEKNHWKMPSLAKKREEVFYEIWWKPSADYELGGYFTCTCYNYVSQGNNNCKHVRRMEELLRLRRQAEQENRNNPTSQIINLSNALAELQSLIINMKNQQAEERERTRAHLESIEMQLTEAAIGFEDLQKVREEMKSWSTYLDRQNEGHAQHIGQVAKDLAKTERKADDALRSIEDQQDIRENITHFSEVEHIHSQKLQEQEALNSSLIAQLNEMRDQIDQLKNKPLSIDAQAITITVGASKTTTPRAPKKPVIEEVKNADGKLIACIVDGSKVLIIDEECAGACYCPIGQNRPCKHTKITDEYLEERKRK